MWVTGHIKSEICRFHILWVASWPNQADEIVISAIEVDNYTCKLQVKLSLKLADLIIYRLAGWLDQADHIKQEIGWFDIW